MEQFIGLISKVSVVLVFIFASVILGETLGAKKKGILTDSKLADKIKENLHQVAQGVVFSVLIVLEMMTAFSGPNGIRYDSRVVLLNLSVTYGPLSGLISAVVAVLIRLRHRTNYHVAISSIVFIYLLELVFIYYDRKKGVKNHYRWIYIMSFLTNIINGIYIITVAGDEWRKAIVPTLTYIVAYPLFTVIAYSVMRYIKGRDELLNELSARDRILQEKNAELSSINDSLKENELKLRMMFSNSEEAIFLIDNYKISDVNLKAIELLGFSDRFELIDRFLPDMIVEIRQEGSIGKAHINEICKRVREGENIKAEVVIRTRNGQEIPLEVFMVDIKVPGTEYIYMSARDIRERKKKECEILYQARHDALTAVANRQYFEESLETMVLDKKNYPLGFMMADINGLKLVNDIFGHAEGDMLIVKIANTLTKICRYGDVVARIGGDEFAIILARADEAAVMAVMARVKESLKHERVETVQPSLSLGYAIKKKPDDGLSVDELKKAADEMMYKNKMEDRKANVRIFLDNMVNRLYEKSKRDRDIAFLLTKYLDRIKNIESFSIVDRREISKIIRYLNLGKLIVDVEDWKVEGESLDEIKLCQKILEGSETILSRIAHAEDNIIRRDEILKLNERWDGKGVFGIKGDDIPLTIRAFTILFDFFYALEHKVKFGYQSEEAVLKAMEEFAGTKYDPKLFLEIKEALEQNK